MKYTLALIAAFLMSFAWLLPYHYRPWATYSSEYLAFAALGTLLLAGIYHSHKLPKQSIGILLLACVPVVQFALGQIYFSSISILGCLYLLGFWLSSIVGYNLIKSSHDKSEVFTQLSYVFTACGLLTASMAIIQWLGVEQSIPGVMNSAARPFANFAQPNNMATFLMMSLLAIAYLYEKQKLKTQWLIFFLVPIVTAIVMSQSRTAWVASLAVFIYFAYQQYRGVLRIRWWQSTAVLLGFVALLMILPHLSQWMVQSTGVEVVQTKNVIARASGDMSRLAIWQQMLHAIALEPWFGHGFYQTSTAFVKVSEFFQGPVWIRSSHNFIIDFLIWTGLVVGVPFLTYFAYVAYRLHRAANNPENVIGLLMIGVFVIHAMFEFPQHYAYFLLPVGFIWGILLYGQSQPCKCEISPFLMKGIAGLTLIFMIWVHHDYNVSVTNLNQAMRIDKTGEQDREIKEVWLLTEFNARAAMIRLNPYTEVDEAVFTDIEKIVQSYPTPYNLLKYARLLAFNGYEDEARYQLKRLYWIKKINVNYDTLLEDAPIKP